MADYDDFDAPPQDAEEHEQPREKRSIRKNIASAWQASPVFKIFLLLVGGGAIASAALGVFSTDKPKDVESRVNSGSAISATPGGEAPPAFQEAVTQASQQRAQSAAQQGGSAMPTPMGDTTQMTNLEPGAQNADDPLAEFRAPQAQQQQPQALPAQQQQQAQQQQIRPNTPAPAPEPVLDQNLASAMQQQMQQIVQGWQPAASKIISVTKIADVTTSGSGGSGQGSDQNQQQAFNRGKTLVPAGTINYGQMSIEANSDVPGPIMAQVLSGPFSGGKVIGRFESTEDYLIMRFTNINFKGKDYPVDILALNPDTTLGAVASETDKRYLSRVIVPAAAEFISGFSRAFTQDSNSTTIVQDGVVISQRSRAGLREGLAQGGQEAGDRISQIINNEASKIKPLVRVAVGTPIGLFFTSSVFENNPEPTYANGVAGVANPYGGQYGSPQFGSQYGAGQYGSGQYGNNSYGSQYGATSGYGNPYASTGSTGYNPYTSGTGYQGSQGYQGSYQSGYPSNAYGGGINVIPAGGTSPVIINR